MAVPIPRFYVVVLFEEIEPANIYVGAESRSDFVRITIDQMARTLPGPVTRELWTRSLDAVIKLGVGDRGYEHEFNITEPPFDLWSLNGHIAPPSTFSGLTRKKDTRVSQLSGGEKRRLDFATAVYGGPSLVILGEPTTGLDIQSVMRSGPPWTSCGTRAPRSC